MAKIPDELLDKPSELLTVSGPPWQSQKPLGRRGGFNMCARALTPRRLRSPKKVPHPA